jgi:hypothetical protein
MMDRVNSAGPIKQTALLLFYGWGYNFYRRENQLRADDLLIRAKAGGILAEARSHLGRLEAEFRRINLPAPTREHPLPDPRNTEQARRIERGGRAIETVATAILNAPAPTDDFIWLRHRAEGGILQTLQDIDIRLVDAAVEFHDRLIESDLAAISGDDLEARIGQWLEPLRVIVRERTERLTLMV